MYKYLTVSCSSSSAAILLFSNGFAVVYNEIKRCITRKRRIDDISVPVYGMRRILYLNKLSTQWNETVFNEVNEIVESEKRRMRQRDDGVSQNLIIPIKEKPNKRTSILNYLPIWKKTNFPIFIQAYNIWICCILLVVPQIPTSLMLI